MGDKAERRLTRATVRRESMGLLPRLGTTIATEDDKEEPGSQDPRERREDKGSTESDNTANGPETEPDYDNGQQKKYKCCGKAFASLRGLKIHQGKVCKRKKDAQQRRSVDRETFGGNPQESNHSGNEPTPEQLNATKNIGDRKPKIKWPKANETAVYEKFDEDVNKLLMKSKGTTEEKLEKLAATIYEEGKKQFGLEAEKRKEPSKKVWTSRRQEKIR